MGSGRDEKGGDRGEAGGEEKEDYRLKQEEEGIEEGGGRRRLDSRDERGQRQDHGMRCFACVNDVSGSSSTCLVPNIILSIPLM